MSAATDDNIATKRGVWPYPAYLDETLTVHQMRQILETLQFNSKEGLARVMIDPGVRDYLLRASCAVGGDPGIKVRHAWRAIRLPR